MVHLSQYQINQLFILVDEYMSIITLKNPKQKQNQLELWEKQVRRVFPYEPNVMTVSIKEIAEAKAREKVSQQHNKIRGGVTLQFTYFDIAIRQAVDRAVGYVTQNGINKEIKEITNEEMIEIMKNAINLSLLEYHREIIKHIYPRF